MKTHQNNSNSKKNTENFFESNYVSKSTVSDKDSSEKVFYLPKQSLNSKASAFLDKTSGPPTKKTRQYSPSLQTSSAIIKREQNNRPPVSTDPLFPVIKQNTVVQHLDLLSFQSKQCQIPTQHNHKHCSFFHNTKDRQRLGDFYSSDLCEYIDKGMNCPYGDVCRFAHNRVEQLYQPGKYKTKFCTYYPKNLKNCEYGQFCSFAHSEEDILIELIHNYEYDDDFYLFYFKTEWCPYNLIQHDQGQCVYAHNWQDFRRRLNDVNYEPVTCSNWRVSEFISNYEEGCPYKFGCEKCHGWKEMEYHPRTYQTKSCPNGNTCQKGRDCPNYHSNKDRRIVPQGILNKVFMYVPQNRALDQMVNSDSKQVNLLPIRGERGERDDKSQMINLESSNSQMNKEDISKLVLEAPLILKNNDVKRILIENYKETQEEKKLSQARQKDLNEFFKKFNLEQDNFNDSSSNEYKSRKYSSSSIESELQFTINLLEEN